MMISDLLLALRHVGERDRLWRLKRALNNAVVLNREEAFRNENPQHDAERQRAEATPSVAEGWFRTFASTRP